jgi:hypothetical protein
MIIMTKTESLIELIEAKRRSFIAKLEPEFQARIASGELYVDVDESHEDLLCSIHPTGGVKLEG